MKTILKTLVFLFFLSCNSDYREYTHEQNYGISLYPNKKLKEFVIYDEDGIIANRGFKPNGDSLWHPTVVYTDKDRNLFVFIPQSMDFKWCTVMLNRDSVTFVDSNLAMQFRQLTKTFHDSLNNIIASKNIVLDSMFIKQKINEGAIMCRKQDDNYEIYPFKF